MAGKFPFVWVIIRVVAIQDDKVQTHLSTSWTIFLLEKFVILDIISYSFSKRFYYTFRYQLQVLEYLELEQR